MLAWSRPDPLTRDLIHLINARRHDHGDTEAAIDTLQAFLELGREAELLTVLAALDEDMAEWLFDLLAEASCTLMLDGPEDEKSAYATMAALALPLQANLTAPLNLKIDPIATADLLHRHLRLPAGTVVRVESRLLTDATLELLDIVYGNDQSEDSYNQALALVSKYPDMELIMAPTTIGIASASKAMQDEGLCDTVKVSGLGLPSEMVEFTLNGCAPEFALWSFVDLGYLTYYTTYLMATGAIKGEVGERFEAGRMGTYAIEKDPTRDQGLRILMGPFSVYNKDNVEAAAK